MNNNFCNIKIKSLAHELQHNMAKAEASLLRYALIQQEGTTVYPPPTPSKGGQRIAHSNCSTLRTPHPELQLLNN